MSNFLNVEFLLRLSKIPFFLVHKILTISMLSFRSVVPQYKLALLVICLSDVHIRLSHHFVLNNLIYRHDGPSRTTIYVNTLALFSGQRMDHRY